MTEAWQNKTHTILVIELVIELLARTEFVDEIVSWLCPGQRTEVTVDFSYIYICHTQKSTMQWVNSYTSSLGLNLVSSSRGRSQYMKSQPELQFPGIGSNCLFGFPPCLNCTSMFFFSIFFSSTSINNWHKQWNIEILHMH